MAEPLIYKNVDYSGGVNERLNGRLISDNEATVLRNVDISIPGLRIKRLGSSGGVVLSTNRSSTSAIHGFAIHGLAIHGTT